MKIGNTEYDVTTQAADIKDALGDWDTMKISDLVGMDSNAEDRLYSLVYYRSNRLLNLKGTISS